MGPLTPSWLLCTCAGVFVSGSGIGAATTLAIVPRTSNVDDLTMLRRAVRVAVVVMVAAVAAVAWSNCVCTTNESLVLGSCKIFKRWKWFSSPGPYMHLGGQLPDGWANRNE